MDAPGRGQGGVSLVCPHPLYGVKYMVCTNRKPPIDTICHASRRVCFFIHHSHLITLTSSHTLDSHDMRRNSSSSRKSGQSRNIRRLSRRTSSRTKKVQAYTSKRSLRRQTNNMLSRKWCSKQRRTRVKKTRGASSAASEEKYTRCIKINLADGSVVAFYPDMDTVDIPRNKIVVWELSSLQEVWLIKPTY